MANEKYFVFFDTQDAGDATAGYKWENSPSGVNSSKAIGRGPVEISKVVEISPVSSAESLSAQEACNAVRKAYGDSQVSGKMKVVLSTNLEEKTAV